MPVISAVSSLRNVSTERAPSDERVVLRTIRGNSIACRELGVPGNPVCICIPGLSLNSISFLDIAERLAMTGYHVVIPDLRGRNLSPATGSGSYGWENHARDMIAIADAVGAKHFSVVGHSMGAYVSMEVAALAGARLDNVVLIDSLGIPETGASAALNGAGDRFGKVYASADAYVTAAKDRGLVKPFTRTWDRMYREEVTPVAGGVTPRTSGAAIEADTNYAVAKAFEPFLFPSLWSKLPVHTLIVRAGVSLSPVFGNIISGSDLARLRAQRPDVTVATAPANHYGIVTDPTAVTQIAEFLKLA